MDQLFNFLGGGVVAVLLPIIIIVLLFAYATSRVKVANANEALVRTGGVFGAPAQLKVVRAGRVIVLPLVHRLGRLHLSARQINIELSDAVTKQGIKCAVQGVATVKIGGDEESIRNAAERFLDSEQLLDSIVKNVLEGSLRSIVGTLTVEELNYDRQKFQQEVQSAAKADLATSGLAIDNFTIQAIRDEVGYMDLIGQQETARRERDARMAKAQADQEAAVREAEASQIKINAERDVSLRRAETLMQIAAAEAKAAQAGPLAQAAAQQEVVRQQTELAQLEADRRQKELIASTIRPAEAEADALVKRAEGDKLARIAAAQAEAERVKLAGGAEAAVQITKGEALARVTAVNAEAEAKRTTLEGNAEAGITFTKGEAEAKALALRADAYRQFNEAAIISTVLSMLPEIVRAAAEPLAAIDNLTVLSTDGASDVVRNATRTVAEASVTVKGLTGIDIPALIGDAISGSSGAGSSAPSRAKRRDGGDGGGEGSGGGGSKPKPGDGNDAPKADAGAMPPPAGDAGPAASASAGSLAGGPGADTASPEQRLAAASDAMRAAAEKAAVPTADALGGLTSPLPPMPAVSDVRPGDKRAIATAAAGTLGLTEASTLDEAAVKLAQELSRIPGIDRFGGTRLRDLDRSGPRTLRTLWGAARGDLDARYGDLTIGKLLDDLEHRHGGSGASH
jgi:flotillin